MTEQKATFAAGCFWGIEYKFSQLTGVLSATSGYTGGHKEDPGYKEVCADTTGHAEAVLVTFDSAIISYEQLLQAFWGMHDPTQLNKQGPDVGSQYRSAIFYHNEEQYKQALQSLESAQANFSQPIVTEIKSAEKFWEAEEYHQKYIEKQGGGSCAI